jgi:tetratricopeptide (TPR) repeat protein
MLVRMLREMIHGARSAASSAFDGPLNQTIEEAKAMVTAGNLTGAESRLRQAVRTWSNSASAHWLLGSVLGASGRLNEAERVLEHALTMEPNNVAALTDLGNVYHQLGRLTDAERLYRRALDIDPASRAVRLSLAHIDESYGRDEAAKRALISLLEPPAFDPALQVLIRLLDRLGQSEEAKQVCVDVLSREPGHGAAQAALGFLLLKRDLKPEAALELFEGALQSGYRNEDVFSNRGIALQDLGQLDAAVASYDAALRLQPDYQLARFHRALALLMRGEFATAWPDYESRLKSEVAVVPPRQLPRWGGEDLPGTTLLVYGEQGIGDEIMFASCLPDLIHRCPRIVLTCAAKLESIMRRSFPQIEIISADSTRERSAEGLLERASVTIAIGSLPLYLRPTSAHFPRHNGYLQADPDLVAHYRERLRALGPGPKVGISWRGGTRQSRQSLRTLGQEHLTAIFGTPGIQFINLQYDSAGVEPEIVEAVNSGRLTHWPEALRDYDHTAALVYCLDVVVSVCTAVIHLAGALGRPVWVMAPFSPEWRYGISGEEMPWYPAAKVIRQNIPGDWAPVIDTVHARLQALVT